MFPKMMQKAQKVLYFVRFLFVLLLLMISSHFACTTPCFQLESHYTLTGCLGKDSCTLTQEGCQVRFMCQTTIQECFGVLVDDVINMSCVDENSESFQTIATLKDDHILLTFVRKNRAICKGIFKGKN